MVYRRLSYGFVQCPYGFRTAVVRPSRTAFVRLSYGFRTVFVRPPYGFRTVLVRLSYGFRTAFVRSSYGLRTAFVRFSCGFRTAFVWFLYGFRTASVRFPYGRRFLARSATYGFVRFRMVSVRPTRFQSESHIFRQRLHMCQAGSVRLGGSDWGLGGRGLGVCAWSGLELILSLPAVLCCSSLVLVFSVYPGNIKTFAATCFQM